MDNKLKFDEYNKLQADKAESNQEWFKDYEFDFEDRVQYADKLELLLFECFAECIFDKIALTKFDLEDVFLAWLIFIALDEFNGANGAITMFEMEYGYSVQSKATQFADEMMRSRETRKLNDYILYGESKDESQTEQETGNNFENYNPQNSDFDVLNNGAGNRKQRTAQKTSIVNKNNQEVSDKAMLENNFDRIVTASRTETNRVCNDRLHTQMSELFKYHIWVSAGDNLVRDTHAEADGQVKPINEPFEVGDSLMMYPCDNSLGAGAEEIVNCRCMEEFTNNAEGE